MNKKVMKKTVVALSFWMVTAGVGMGYKGCGAGVSGSHMVATAEAGEPVPGAEVYIEQEPNNEPAHEHAHVVQQRRAMSKPGEPVPGAEIYLELEPDDD